MWHDSPCRRVHAPSDATIHSKLVELFGKGWRPRYDWHDPVVWRRREHNRRADHLANVTMDIQQSWTEERPLPFPGHDISKCKLVVHSDGGARANCASAAWIVEAGLLTNGAWDCKVLTMGGIFFDVPVTSFTAETVAWDNATKIVKTFLARAQTSGARTRHSWHCRALSCNNINIEWLSVCQPQGHTRVICILTQIFQSQSVMISNCSGRYGQDSVL